MQTERRPIGGGVCPENEFDLRRKHGFCWIWRCFRPTQDADRRKEGRHAGMAAAGDVSGHMDAPEIAGDADGISRGP